ncbi:MAG: hypothetical protein MUE44_01795 [Oscillatoriaceae cyanobacterium Prado104]|nr:hypothetical protein [Oscillatoriaceae cyanobacterium Prado104]
MPPRNRVFQIGQAAIEYLPKKPGFFGIGAPPRNPVLQIGRLRSSIFLKNPVSLIARSAEGNRSAILLQYKI